MCVYVFERQCTVVGLQGMQLRAIYKCDVSAGDEGKKESAVVLQRRS